MTERELLEMAARAVGISGQYFQGVESIHTGIYRAEHDYYWNPLESDSEALRLAVNLQLTICIEQFSSGFTYCVHRICDTTIAHPAVNSGGEGEVSDENYSAVRRAIVIAAAEIGRAMP